eukprot:6485537-Amphidinium_carterae.4
MLKAAEGVVRPCGWSRSEENPGSWQKQVSAANREEPGFKEKEADFYRYLGANHSIAGGKMEVEMSGYAQKAVDRLESELGLRLRTAITPYVSDGVEKDALESDAAGQHVEIASSLSKWEHVHDVHLRRLLEYLKGSVDVCLVSQIEPNAPLEFIIWIDADLNGDPVEKTMRKPSLQCEDI